MRSIVSVIAFALISVGLAEAASGRAGGRALEVEDLNRSEGLGMLYGGAVVYAPSGDQFAITRVRPREGKRDFSIQFLSDNDLGDVWVHLADGRFLNVTQGAEDGSGWWAPRWSPDGRYVSMLSTRGETVADNVWLWVWDSRTGALRRLSELGVDLDMWESNVFTGSYTWLDAEHVLCPFLLDGRRTSVLDAERRSQRVAAQTWPKAILGKEATVSVLEAGANASSADVQPAGRLVRINVTDGTQTTVAEGKTFSFLISPDQRYVAYARQIGVYKAIDGETVPQSAPETFTVEVIDRAANRVLSAQGHADDYRMGSLRWSVRGDQIVFLSYGQRREAIPRLIVGDVRSGTLRDMDLGSLDLSPDYRLQVVPQIEWTVENQLLVRGTERKGDRMPSADQRRDWWLVSLNGVREPVTHSMSEPPIQLWRQRNSNAFVGYADGEIWRIAPERGAIENITSTISERIAGISWPQRAFHQSAGAGDAYTRVYIDIRREGRSTYHRLDLANGRVSSVIKPDPGAELIAVSGEEFLFLRQGMTGIKLWRKVGTERTSNLLIDGNQFLGELAHAPVRQFQYTSLNGESLKGWLVLPLRYQNGRRYPLITWVYPGRMLGDEPPSEAVIENGLGLLHNMQIPAARGYAVLIPSMPASRFGDADDYLLGLPNGVLPAVDQVVQMGVADPSRLFLMGHSFGGYATYGLITQTNRFAAAVASAGFANLISVYGQFDARNRYTDTAHLDGGITAMMEGGSVALGGPPWSELSRYLRNSPILYVDRVRTPLMIVQGDMDYVPIQQGEEFFTALHRMGRRAKFVRYWGEGHTVASPANTRDYWSRIFAWFSEHEDSEHAHR